jgi:hypothetical protein
VRDIGESPHFQAFLMLEAICRQRRCGIIQPKARGIGGRMKRRQFLAVAGGALVGLNQAARAQQAAMPVVGFLNPTSHKLYDFNAAAFRQGLKDVGFIEGENVRIEYRWAEGDYGRLPVLLGR